MHIIGNITTANKFYIINSLGNIEWVPNFEIAKKYISNPMCKEWYNNTLYATSEDIILDDSGRAILKSKYVKKDIKYINNENGYDIFKKQAEEYNKTILNEYCLHLGFENILELISWKDSTIKDLSNKAKKMIKYRDEVYKFYYKSLESFSKDIENNNILENSLSEACQKYITEFPVYEKGEE